MRVGKFDCGTILPAQRVARLRQRKRGEIGHPAFGSSRGALLFCPSWRAHRFCFFRNGRRLDRFGGKRRWLLHQISVRRDKTVLLQIGKPEASCSQAMHIIPPPWAQQRSDLRAPEHSPAWRRRFRRRFTSSFRIFIAMGVTEVIGSTPATSTSASCSTKASMAFSSPRRCSTSSSATAMRARCATRRTCRASTDIAAGLAGIRYCATPIAERPFAANSANRDSANAGIADATSSA